MESRRNPLQDFILTSDQQTLLLAALNSQHPAHGQPTNGLPMSSTFEASPGQQGAIFYDHDLSGADSTVDFSLVENRGDKVMGDVSGRQDIQKSETPDNADSESPDKRSHPADDDDEEEEASGAKRRESEDKVAKKPGRKPLTTEPTSKRKAQNRAAQRAFRERKEKHLKDLENLVEELQKSSESASHENKQLRAKVDKMTVELTEYKKRLSLMANYSSVSKPTVGTLPNAWYPTPMASNVNDVNFRFEFPKFGVLPGAPVGTEPPNSLSGSSVEGLERAESGQLSSMESAKDAVSPSNVGSFGQGGLDSQKKDDLVNFTSLYRPVFPHDSISNASRTSHDSHYSIGGGTNTSSPSAPSLSAGGPGSSCGTSPEPITQSPTSFKPVDALTTIGEEHSGFSGANQDLGTFSGGDVNDFNWLPQNNFQFDPNLFGDYREPQENILSAGFEEGFFTDAFGMDFTQPYNAPLAGAPAVKKNLIARIDEAKETEESGNNAKFLDSAKIWDELSSCPKVQSGDFDLEALCSDLKRKAKCSGTGPAVGEKDFHKILGKYLGNCEGLKSETTSGSKA